MYLVLSLKLGATILFFEIHVTVATMHLGHNIHCCLMRDTTFCHYVKDVHDPFVSILMRMHESSHSWPWAEGMVVIEMTIFKRPALFVLRKFGFD